MKTILYNEKVRFYRKKNEITFESQKKVLKIWTIQIFCIYSRSEYLVVTQTIMQGHMNLNLLFRITHTPENLEQVVSAICRKMNVKTTHRWLTEQLCNHPDYPSLAALSDCFDKLGFTTQGLQLSRKENIKKVDTPHIVQTKDKDNGELFTVVFRYGQDYVDWLNPKTNNEERIIWSEFQEYFTGYALLLSESTSNQEPDYYHHLREDVFQNTLLIVSTLAPVFGVVLAALHANISLTFIAILVIGYILGLLLMLREVSVYSPFVQKICGGGRKLNCTAVLSSKASKFLGVPWAVWGSAYFLAGLISLSFIPSIIPVWSYLHLLALPYIIFSLYYQRFIIKQWCPLCLGVLVCIATLPLSAYWNGYYNQIAFVKDIYTPILGIVFSGLLSFLIFYMLWKWGIAWRNRKWLYKTYTRLRLSPNVFEAMLSEEPEISHDYKGLGVTLGNPRGRFQLLEICNPFCTPCADAHKELHLLLQENKEVGLQILFLYPAGWCERSPIPTLLSLKHDARLLDALSSWFASEDKNIKSFNEKYSSQLNLEITQQHLQMMEDFCTVENINATPTIFVNGHKLPSSYSVGDLRYCL